MKKGKDRIVTFTTDFGYQDPYAAMMKGVVLAINHRVRCIDITHAIKPHDVSQAAFIAGTAGHWFPEGTIHVVVVDPGVGTDRRALVVKAGGQTWVGPDNGVFTLIYDRGPATVHQITNKKYMLPTISQTFHGRDVFSPVAAWLSKGIRAVRLGREISDYVRLPFKQPEQTGDRIIATVIHIDTFGNIITNVPEKLIKPLVPNFRITVGDHVISTLSSSYVRQDANTPLAIIGSAGFLEIACPQASAAQRYQLKVSDQLIIERS